MNYLPVWKLSFDWRRLAFPPDFFISIFLLFRLSSICSLFMSSASSMWPIRALHDIVWGGRGIVVPNRGCISTCVLGMHYICFRDSAINLMVELIACFPLHHLEMRLGPYTPIFSIVVWNRFQLQGNKWNIIQNYNAQTFSVLQTAVEQNWTPLQDHHPSLQQTCTDTNKSKTFSSSISMNIHTI